MKIVGLTGGIASGKSAVAAELAALGAVVLDADETAHHVLDHPEVQQQLIERWGKSIVGEDGRIDRRAVGQRVFDQIDRTELVFLEATLHPRIRAQFEAELAELAKQGVQVAVIDAPLLLEAGWQNLCDELIFVDSPREMRLHRAKSLRNWTEEEFSKREACQMPIAQKRDLSTCVLDNSGTLEDLSSQIHQVWAKISSKKD